MSNSPGENVVLPDYPLFHNHLQNFEVNRSTVRYEKNISLPRFGNFRVLVEIFFRFVIVAKFRIFREILQKFREKSKIFKPR